MVTIYPFDMFLENVHYLSLFAVCQIHRWWRLEWKNNLWNEQGVGWNLWVILKMDTTTRICILEELMWHESVTQTDDCATDASFPVFCITKLILATLPNFSCFARSHRSLSCSWTHRSNIAGNLWYENLIRYCTSEKAPIRNK